MVRSVAFTSLPPDIIIINCSFKRTLSSQNCTVNTFPFFHFGQALDLLVSVSSAGHPAYTPDLSPRVLRGVLPAFAVGNLFSRGASRLDAFSAYPFPTWLPSGAPGGTTGSPEVSPSRSSRTKDSSSQISCARDG